MNESDALSKTNFVSLPAEPSSDSVLTELDAMLSDLDLSPEKLDVLSLAQKYNKNLRDEKKAKRELGKAASEEKEANKPKKHREDYKLGAAGRSCQEIDQWRRDNREEWNEKCRVNYAVKMELEQKRAVREYRRDPEAQAENKRMRGTLNVAKHRAGLTEEQKAEKRKMDSERKRLARAKTKAANGPDIEHSASRLAAGR